MTRVISGAESGPIGDRDTWTLANAKAHFSEVVNRAKGAPQTITRNGRPAAVIVTPEEWERKTRRASGLVDFFAASPLRGQDDLVIDRRGDVPRKNGV